LDTPHKIVCRPIKLSEFFRSACTCQLYLRTQMARLHCTGSKISDVTCLFLSQIVIGPATTVSSKRRAFAKMRLYEWIWIGEKDQEIATCSSTNIGRSSPPSVPLRPRFFARNAVT